MTKMTLMGKGGPVGRELTRVRSSREDLKPKRRIGRKVGIVVAVPTVLIGLGFATAKIYRSANPDTRRLMETPAYGKSLKEVTRAKGVRGVDVHQLALANSHVYGGALTSGDFQVISGLAKRYNTNPIAVLDTLHSNSLNRENLSTWNINRQTLNKKLAGRRGLKGWEVRQSEAQLERANRVWGILNDVMGGEDKDFRARFEELRGSGHKKKVSYLRGLLEKEEKRGR